MRADPEKRNPGVVAGASENAQAAASAWRVYATPRPEKTPIVSDDIAARHRRALSAFRLSAGVMRADAERLTWIAYEIGRHAEIASLQSLSDEAAQIALRAFDASEVLG